MGQTTSKNTTTKTNENQSPSSFMHKLVSNWFLSGSYGSYCSLPTSQGSRNSSHPHALFQDRFKNVQVGSSWFSTTVHPITKLSHRHEEVSGHLQQAQIRFLKNWPWISLATGYTGDTERQTLGLSSLIFRETDD